MHDSQPQAARATTLLGGGPVDPDQLNLALSLAPKLVAADGGAEHALRLGLPVTKILGDLDSLTNLQFWRDQGVDLVKISEQDSTDFEKCITHEDADVFVGVGFLGRRLDHSLANLRTLAAYPDQRVLLIGETDIVFLSPPEITLELAVDTRVSLFPMTRVLCGPSKGLRWPIDGLVMEPDGQIGTSNRTVDARVEMIFPDARPLVMVPALYLEECLTALQRAR